MIKVILVDAANTIIHKPILWTKINEVFLSHNICIPIKELKEKHKLISEIINFPDRTNEEFYKNFNSEFVLSLGILPSENLVNDLFKACTYLFWEAFDDVQCLNELNYKRAVLSNFNSGLESLLKTVVPVNFDTIMVSEIEKARKPQVEFYKNVIAKLGVNPDEIVYIGDSIKLDIIPSLNVGMNALLIDRENHYPHFKNRINSFGELAAKIVELNK